jgi:hypothetical protein
VRDKSLVMVAAERGHDEILWALLSAGAEVFPVDKPPCVVDAEVINVASNLGYLCTHSVLSNLCN